MPIKEQHFQGDFALIEVDALSKTGYAMIALALAVDPLGHPSAVEVHLARVIACKHLKLHPNERVLITYQDGPDVPLNDQNAPLDGNRLVPDPTSPSFQTHPKKAIRVQFAYGWQTGDQDDFHRAQQEANLQICQDKINAKMDKQALRVAKKLKRRAARQKIKEERQGQNLRQQPKALKQEQRLIKKGLF